MGGSRGEPAGESGKDFTNWIPACYLDQECAQRPRAGRYSSVSNVLFQSQGSARLGVERRGSSVATDRRGQSGERIE